MAAAYRARLIASHLGLAMAFADDHKQWMKTPARSDTVARIANTPGLSVRAAAAQGIIVWATIDQDELYAVLDDRNNSSPISRYISYRSKYSTYKVL